MASLPVMASGRRIGVLTVQDEDEVARSFRLAVSENWIVQAAALPGRSLHIALMLLLSVNLARKQTVELPNLHCQLVGLDRNAKYRALQWLERAGLVRVERRVGSSPLVTLVDMEEKQ